MEIRQRVVWVWLMVSHHLKTGGRVYYHSLCDGILHFNAGFREGALSSSEATLYMLTSASYNMGLCNMSACLQSSLEARQGRDISKKMEIPMFYKINWKWYSITSCTQQSKGEKPPTILILGSRNPGNYLWGFILQYPKPVYSIELCPSNYKYPLWDLENKARWTHYLHLTFRLKLTSIISNLQTMCLHIPVIVVLESQRQKI